MMPITLSVSRHDDHVCVELYTWPFSQLLGKAPLTTEQAYDLANALVDAAEAIDPPTAAPKPRYRIRVERLKGITEVLWTFSCPQHEGAGIGLWQDQEAAYAAAIDHVTVHHS